MPRPRTARIPLVRSSASRTERSRSRDRKPARARLVAFALVLVSLALVTVYFRESSDGALHGTQRIGISVLAPFEIAGERVAQPFQDAYGWSATSSRPRRRTRSSRRSAGAAPAGDHQRDRGARRTRPPPAPQVPRRAAFPEGLPRRRDARLRRAADGIPPGRARRRGHRTTASRSTIRSSSRGPRRHRDRGRAERVEGARCSPTSAAPPRPTCSGRRRRASCCAA